MTEIKPALAAEEWSTPWGGMHSARGVDQQFTLHLLGERGASKWLSIKLDGRVWNLREPDSFAVVMAFANAALPDSDPRKITRDRLRAFNAIISTAEDHWDRGPESEGWQSDELVTNIDLVRQLRDAIAALLPPE